MTKRILVADDMRQIREIGAIVIESCFPGTVVDQVDSSKALLEKVRTNGNYDLIVTDDNMPPGITGLQALLELRAEGKLGKAILYTSSNPTRIAEIQSHGIEYLPKAITNTQYKEAIGRALGEHQQPARSNEATG